MYDPEQVAHALKEANYQFEHMMDTVNIPTHTGLPTETWRQLYGGIKPSESKHRCHYCGVVFLTTGKSHCKTCGAPR